MTGQSLMYTRLQTRLNPVPESLNSPDMHPPTNLGRPPPKDDPIRFYNRDLGTANRDLAISSSTVSTTSSSSLRTVSQPQTESSLNNASDTPKKESETNGYRYVLKPHFP